MSENNLVNSSLLNFSQLAAGRWVRKNRWGTDLKGFLKYINRREYFYFERLSIAINISSNSKPYCHGQIFHDFMPNSSQMYHYFAFSFSSVNAISVIGNCGLFAQYGKKYEI